MYHKLRYSQLNALSMDINAACRFQQVTGVHLVHLRMTHSMVECYDWKRHEATRSNVCVCVSSRIVHEDERAREPKSESERIFAKCEMPVRKLNLTVALNLLAHQLICT